jgi:hypothetical protein
MSWPATWPLDSSQALVGEVTFWSWCAYPVCAGVQSRHRNPLEFLDNVTRCEEVTEYTTKTPMVVRSTSEMLVVGNQCFLSGLPVFFPTVLHLG